MTILVIAIMVVLMVIVVLVPLMIMRIVMSVIWAIMSMIRESVYVDRYEKIIIRQLREKRKDIEDGWR